MAGGGPGKHEKLKQCWIDVGPSSATLSQHQTNIGSTSRVGWVYARRYVNPLSANLNSRFKSF